MDSVIYYFTGTGNSLKVAKDIAEEVKETKLVQITKNNLETLSETLYGRIGIIFPVYFSGLPFIVRELVERLDIDKSAYVYAVSTSGAASGVSTFQLEKILNSKGIRLSSAFNVQMPGNYQVMYDVKSQEVQNKLFKAEEIKVKDISMSINNNEIVKLDGKGNSIFKLFGGAIYKTFKPNGMDKNFWADEGCNGCGTCSRVCPASNIKMVEGKPQWQHKCEQCMACIQWCPQKSIQYKKGTIKKGRYNNPHIKLNELLVK